MTMNRIDSDNIQAASFLLEWYLEMGVNDVLEEQPQNRMNASYPQPAAQIYNDSSNINIHNNNISQGTNKSDIAKNTPNNSKISGKSVPNLAAEAARLAETANNLAELQAVVEKFHGLSICKTATNTVFAEGVTPADIMVIGEAPGAQEDRTGVPFCGPSGQLLDKMLNAIGYNRKQNCYITNVIFWRPPGNRPPSQEECVICKPFVQKHIALVNPKILLIAGGVAMRTLLDEDKSLGRIRGTILQYNDSTHSLSIPAIATYHPSYLLRQPAQKKLAWKDFLLLKAQLTT